MVMRLDGAGLDRRVADFAEGASAVTQANARCLQRSTLRGRPMILRSVVRHVRDQNWIAVGIDFAIVVIGVFFGIQVSNWNESRREALRADGYLARIHDDLSADQQSLARHAVFWRQVVGHGQAAIRYAETGELVDGSAWKTLLAFYQASQLFPWLTRDTTYQELRSAGELGLITDDDLRAALAEYYVTGNGAQFNFLLAVVPEYRTPSIASAQVWAKCHSAPAFDQQYLHDCDSPMPEVDAQAVLDAYLADPRLLLELRFWITTLEVSLTLVELNRKDVRELIVRLPDEKSR